MPPHFEHSGMSRYDGIEILTVGLGVVLIVTIVLVFGL
jgi:hypothetical protein